MSTVTQDPAYHLYFYPPKVEFSHFFLRKPKLETVWSHSDLSSSPHPSPFPLTPDTNKFISSLPISPLDAFRVQPVRAAIAGHEAEGGLSSEGSRAPAGTSGSVCWGLGIGGQEPFLPPQDRGVSYRPSILIPFEFAHLSESRANTPRAFNEWQSASRTF